MKSEKPTFMFLRIFTIPIWMAIHYAIAAFIMFFATPSPVVVEIERASQHVISQYVWAFAFSFSAFLLSFDNHVTPRKLRMYLLAWLSYVIATSVLALKAFVTEQDIPGIYIALLAYSGEMVFMLLSYSTYQSVWNVAEKLTDLEPLWRKLLTKTDLKWLDRE